MSVSNIMRERLLDLAWSLWTGLGLPGQIDNHYDHAIDPEPLVIFTAALGDADPRLRNEATDWCIRYGSLVSGARLKNLLAEENDRVRARYGEFAETVATHSSIRWPERTTEREHKPRKRPRVQAFNRQAQMVLRLRAWLGIGARAEIIRAFLAHPDTAFSASDLAVETNYSKRSIAQVLDVLCLGDVVQAFPIRNQIHYRMPRERVDHLSEQLAPVPVIFVRWPVVLRVLLATFEAISRFESKSDTVRTVEVRAFVEKLDTTIRAAQLPCPIRSQSGPSFWGEFTSWAVAVASNLAAGNEPAGDRFKARWNSAPGQYNGEVMERGDLAIWESPMPGGSLRWTFGFHGKQQPQDEFDHGVRYPTVNDAKRTAEIRQFTLDKKHLGVG